MNDLALPVATATVVLAAVVCFSMPRLSPRASAVITLLSMSSMAVTALWLVSVPSVAFLLHTSSSEWLRAWCSSFLPHVETPVPLGIAALTVLTTQTVRVTRQLGRLRNDVRAVGRGPELTVVAQAAPLAVTTPGRHGRIIVSSGLLRSLAPAQQRALLAHERAHLECRHDRFLGLSALAAAAFPPVARMAPLLRRSLERWADERAAEETGDRQALADAIAIAALAPSNVAPLASGIAASDVELRLLALSAEPARTGPLLTATGAVLGLLAAIATAASLGGLGFQMHHVGELLVHVCPF